MVTGLLELIFVALPVTMNSQKFCAPISSMISHALSHALAEASRPSSVDLPSMVMFFTSSHRRVVPASSTTSMKSASEGSCSPLASVPAARSSASVCSHGLRLLM